MADELYERYKNALRSGHVAVLRGHLPEALAAYREAAAIAPERALPHTSLGGAFLRLGRVDEALVEYDAALERAPRDEAVLLGRAEALVAAGRPTEAAESLDGVAGIQEASGRLPEAIDTIRRAIELQATPERLGRREALTLEAQPTLGEAVADEGLGRALRVLESTDARGTGDVAASGPGETAEAGPIEAPPAIELAPDGEPAARDELHGDPDLARMTAAADAALDRAGGPEAARDALIALARARGQAGLLDAALDAAHLALALAPADTRLHLALVDLYLARGWRDLAAEKLELLGRLAVLRGDDSAQGEVARAAAASFEDDRRFRALPE